jgi:hypothetical protein
MNPVRIAQFSILFIWLTTTALAQTNPSLAQFQTNSTVISGGERSNSPTTTKADTGIDWLLVFQQQAKTYETVLQAQQTLSEKTLSSIERSNEHLISLAHLVGIVVTILIGVFGAWVWTQVNTVRKLPKEATNRMKAVENKLREIESKFQGFDTIFASTGEKLNKLQTDVQKAIEDIQLRTEIARRRVELTSLSHKERLRSVQAIGQMTSPLVVPILKQTLQDLNQPPEILAEALYGLARWKQLVVQDMEATTLVATASKHQTKLVRFASAEAMGRIDPHNATFRTRLIEMRDHDVDEDIKNAARHALQDSGS